MISVTRAREVLNYDPTTGNLTWRVKTCRKVVVGKIAGHTSRGYRSIRIDGVLYQAHFIAWLIHYGLTPGLLDHRDLNGLNNAISNLREATKSSNGANRPKPANNTSGHKGVGWDRGKWKVSVGRKHVGRFADLSDAVTAYELAASERYGEFARAA